MSTVKKLESQSQLAAVPSELETLKLLVDSVCNEAIFTLDLHGHITTSNSGAEPMCGYSSEELLGRHYSCLYPREDIDSGKLESALHSAAESGRYENEGWQLRKDASRFWANIVITALRRPDGRLIGYGMMIRDLSDRKETERMLSESEERFRLLIANVKDYAICLLDPYGRITTWNQGAQRIIGYEPEEVLGKHYSRFFTIEDAGSGKPEQEIRQASLIGRYHTEGWRMRRGDERFFADVVITPLLDDHGGLRGFSLVVRDITERKQAQEALRESEERFRLMVDGVRDYAIFLLDLNGCVISWNIGAERINGYKPQEILGEHISRFYTEEDLRAGKPRNELIVAEREGRYEEDGWRVRKDGSLFWANVVITALRDEMGRLRGFSKVTRDISERRRYEQEQARLLVEAKRAVKARDEFLSVASHELNTPLTSLKLQLQATARVFERHRGHPEEVIHRISRLIRVSETQLDRLTHLIQGLLEVSSIYSRELRLHRSNVNLARVVQSVVERNAEEIKASGCTVEMDLDPRISGHFDRRRIEEVFSHLLRNALIHAPGTEIAVSVFQADGEARLVVQDKGPGITEEDLSRVFKQYERLSAENASGGLGLGLYIAQSIVEAHGGFIELKSKQGFGATFTVRLPIQPYAEVEKQKPA